MLTQNGNVALSIMSRVIRQAGYRHFEAASPPPLTLTKSSAPAIKGANNCTTQANIPENICLPGVNSLNGSDAIEIRFDGAGWPKADGTMLDCAGAGVLKPKSTSNKIDFNGYSAFYIGRSTVNKSEPTLYCKSRGKGNNWTAAPLIDGAENLQILYGLDEDGNHIANRFLPANALSTVQWCHVVSVKIALLLRGSAQAKYVQSARSKSWHLFGKDYQSSQDIGTFFEPKTELNRPRKLFSTFVQLRNPQYCSS